MQCISHLWSRNRARSIEEDINADLTDKYEKTQGHMEELKHDLDKKTEEYKNQKVKSDGLEETVSRAHHKRHLDLKDLWRLVRDDELECMSPDEGQDTPLTVSSDSVRDQVAKEIQSLRSQLARSQKALEVLQSKTVPQSLDLHDTHGLQGKRTHSPSSPLVEALILDYNGDVSSNGKARKGACVSADSILDEHHVSFTGSLEEDSLKQLATSCPQLEHRQQQPPPYTRSRPPQIGTTRYTIVNTSTGSSTSGAVDLDISSGSNKSEPHGVFHGHRKSVLIVETTCTPDTPSSPDDPSDPLNRYRTSSFKRAIERGASGDSSQQSFETADPPSTSPDLTPEHGDLPPYPAPPIKNFPDNTLYPYDRYSRHLEQSSGDYQIPKPCDVSPDLSWVEQPSRDYTEDDPRYRTSTPDTSLDHTETEPNEKTPLVDAKLSPRTSRRLSTLVEESDAETEEGRGRGSSAGARRTPMLLTPSSGSPARPKTPPGYKAPPAYRTLSPIGDKMPPATPPYRPPPPAPSRKLSPGVPSQQHVQIHQEIPRSPTAHCTFSKHGHGEVVEQPVRRQSRSRSPTKDSAHDQRRSEVRARRSSHESRSRSPVPCDRKFSNSPVASAMGENLSHSPLASPRSHKRSSARSSVTATRSPSTADSKLSILVNGNLPESELSEEDRQLNAQLLEDAKRASSQSRHRGRKPRRGSGPDLVRSQTFDEGENDDDVFAQMTEACPSEGSPSRTQCTQTSPQSPQSPKDSDADVSEPALQSQTASQNEHLSKIRRENLAKKRSLTKQVKMPELAETLEEANKALAKAEGATATNHVDLFDEDSVSARAFPNLPDETLERMGLLRRKGEPLNSGEHLTTEQDIERTKHSVEEKFASLSLAFKTDKLTLEQRIEIHERSRDRAEQNIDKELESLKKAMLALSPFCTDDTSRDLFSKIQHHVEVLEQSTSRVSSRAEVHGAVQQELRLSKAVEVMMQHVENLKHLYEKEHTELEETRKLLQENKMQTQEGEGSGLKRYSLAGVSSTKPGGRRRASLAVFPRRASILGAANSSSLESLDPKSRLQLVIADTAVKSNVTHAFRDSGPVRRSLESGESPSEEKPPLPLINIAGESPCENNNNNLSPTTKSDLNPSTPDDIKNIDEDMAYQRGFEEGVRTQLQHHLADLAEQQRGMSDVVEQLMEQNDMDDEETRSEETILRRMREMLPCWEVAGKHIRYTIAFIVLLMGLLAMLVTLLPRGIHAHQPAQYDVDWSSIHALLRPYTHVKHNRFPLH